MKEAFAWAQPAFPFVSSRLCRWSGVLQRQVPASHLLCVGQFRAGAFPDDAAAVDDLEAALEAVSKAGGAITKPVFAFPGGRRFHFRDPSGNELAALKAD